MVGPTPAARWLVALVLGSLVLLSTAACGEETAPADRVPELATLLDQVDEAVADGDDEAARRGVEELMAATEDARDQGDLDAAEADEILTAADRVLDGLPEEPVEEPTGEPTPAEESPPSEETQPPPPPEEEGDGEDDKEDKDKEEKDKTKNEDKGKGNGEGKSEDD